MCEQKVDIADDSSNAFTLTWLYNVLISNQSIVRKKMATGTFTYNVLRTKTLKERLKTQRKIVSLANSTRAMLYRNDCR